MRAGICSWVRRVFPRYFVVKDAAVRDHKDRRVERAAAEQKNAAERLTESLVELRASLVHHNRQR